MREGIRREGMKEECGWRDGRCTGGCGGERGVRGCKGQ